MEDLGSGGFGCGARVYLRCRVFSGVGSEVKLWGLRFEDLWFRVLGFSTLGHWGLQRQTRLVANRSV